MAFAATDADVFWEGVRIFHSHANDFVDSGLYVYFEVGALIFSVKPFLAVNQTAEELEALLTPMAEELDAAGVTHTLEYSSYDTFYELYVDLFDDEVAGGFSLTGGWLFTHRDVEENNDGIVEALQTAVSPREDLKDQGFLVGHLWNAGYGRPEANSATNALFREATDYIISTLDVPVGSSEEVKADYQDVLTNVVDEALRTAGKHGCAYVNEVSLGTPGRSRGWY